MKDRNWAHRRCRNLVWTLTATGLLSGMVVVSVMSWCLKAIRVDRVERDQVAQVSAEVLNSVDQWMSEGISAANDFLAGKTPTLLIPVRQAKRRDIERKVRTIDDYVPAKELKRELAQFEKMVWDCRRFAQEVRICDAERHQAWEACTQSLQQLSDALDWESDRSSTLGFEPLTTLLRKQVVSSDHAPGNSETLTVDRELAELVLLLTLISKDSFDVVADLETDRFRPMLQRLQTQVTTHPETSPALRDALNGFEVSLLGPRLPDGQDESQDESQPRDEPQAQDEMLDEYGGLLAMCRERLQLETERQRLLERAQERTQRLRTVQGNLWRRLNKMTDNLARNAAQNMFWAWSIIVFSAAFCAILFLILSRQIACMITLQVAEKDAQAKKLEKEVHERIQAENEQERLHAELQESARYAGMAEVATGVLHNVGNVLNSVNVSANILLDSVNSRTLKTLARVANLLENAEQDLATFFREDGRGKHVPTLVAEISKTLGHERDLQLSELNDLVKNVDHIKTIVAMQQLLASRGGATERTSLTELLEDAVELNSAGIRQHGIRLERQYDQQIEVLIDRHQVLQILVNLIKNGVEAMQASQEAERVLSLEVRDEEHCIALEVRDTGCGIATENIDLVFQLGFTTKKTGHGFGLHNSANVAQEAGGSLIARSDGVGRGASFVLRLPKDNRSDSGMTGDVELDQPHAVSV